MRCLGGKPPLRLTSLQLFTSSPLCRGSFSWPCRRSCLFCEHACHHVGEEPRLPCFRACRLGPIRSIFGDGVPTMDAGKVCRVWAGEKKAAC